MAHHSRLENAAQARAWLVTCVTRGVNALIASQPETKLPSLEERSRFYYLLRLSLVLPDTWPTIRQALERWLPRLNRFIEDPGWLQLLEALRDRAHSLDDSQTEAWICLHLGGLYRMQGHYPDARAALERAAALFEAVDDVVGVAQAWAYHAYLAYQEHDLERARQLLQEATASGAANEGDTPRMLDLRAYIHLIQGALAYEDRDWDTALGHMEQAYRLWVQAGELHMAGIALSNYALFLERSGRDLEEAQRCYEEALSLLEQVGARVDWAVTQMNFGLLWRRLGKVDRALVCYRQAEPIFRQAGMPLRLARLYNNIGYAYYISGRLAEAEHAYRLSLQEWSRVPNLAGQLNTWNNLLTLLRDQGRWEEMATACEQIRLMYKGTSQDVTLLSLYREFLSLERQALAALSLEKEDRPGRSARGAGA